MKNKQKASPLFIDIRSRWLPADYRRVTSEGLADPGTGIPATDNRSRSCTVIVSLFVHTKFIMRRMSSYRSISSQNCMRHAQLRTDWSSLRYMRPKSGFDKMLQ